MDGYSNLVDYINQYNKETNKVLQRVFSGQIKGTFLIEIKTRVLTYLGNDIGKYYDLSFDKEKILTSDNENIVFDICRHIVGLHSSHLIFATEDERLEKEKSEEYKRLLIKEVAENVKLRNYGSAYFRRKSLLKGENFIFYHVPYDLFVLCTRICELSGKNSLNDVSSDIIYAISEKSLAALILLEDNLLSDAFPLCRSATELCLKMFVLSESPKAELMYSQFADFEIENACGEQKYPKELEDLYKKRLNKSCTNKIDYLHYGWLDSVNGYHLNGMRPYSVSGIISYLKTRFSSDNISLLSDMEYLYKTCHIYSHGNTITSKYRLIEYFQISRLLQYSVGSAYKLLCGRLQVSMDINGINMVSKFTNDVQMLVKQHRNASTENLERYSKEHKY